MSRSETGTTLRSTNFHTGGMSSGLAIHEREREEERRRRARLARQASNSGDIPLFEEPRRVQPSTDDLLQQRIQATLGNFNTIAPSVFQHQNHFLGIPRLPQTPVEGDQKFIFDAKNKDAKKAKAAAVISGYEATLKKALNNAKVKEEVNGMKNKNVNGILNSLEHATTKSPLVSKAQEAIVPSKNSTLSHLKSPPLPDMNPSKVDVKKTEVKPVANGVLKSRQGDDKVKERGKVKVKVEKDERARIKSESENSESGKGQMLKSNTTNKSKPPKIKLPERSVTAASTEENHLVNEPSNVEKIIAEMQQVAPPLTGIHTPIKGGSSIFAFGHRSVAKENSVLPVLAAKRKLSESTEVKKENGNGEVLLNDDLMLTDESDDEHDHKPDSPSKTAKNVRHRSHSTSSSGSSSDDSDSDSSDSDSDSSASDTNNNTKDKPARPPAAQSPSSSPKHASGRNWGLTHFVNALSQSSTPPTTKTKPSPSAANTVGEDGVRGNQVAPAANANKSSLNSHISNQTSAVSKEMKSPVPPAPADGLVPFAADLLSNSPDVDQGFDIESLTAKLDVPLEGDTATNPSKPVSSDPNGLTVKIQLPKKNKKVNRKLSASGPKLNSVQEKSQSEETPSPKKPVKNAKKETKTPKNSASSKASNNNVDETPNKAGKTSKTGNGVAGMKSAKKKVETKSAGDVITGNEPVKAVCEVDDEDVIVDIVGMETSPVKLDAKPASKTKETEKLKGSKSKAVVTNGLNKPVNGEKLLSSLISPNRTKDILGKNVEITYDEVNKPESLIVKIDLSLLKRIPKLNGNEPIKQEQAASSPVTETNGITDAIRSPGVKIPKRKLSDVKPLEHELPKKVKSESDADTNQAKPRERSYSSSSTNSRHNKGSHRKSSPSQEKDSYRIKRLRHDSESNKVDDNSVQSYQNGSLAENGVDATDSGFEPHQCSCSAKSEDNRRELDIARFYDPEPRVPYGPDHYLSEAKKLKHKADSSSDKEAKAFFYIEAVLYFARCGKAIEQNEESEISRSAFQMYSETLDLLRYTMRNFVNRYTHRSHNVPDKRLSALCMRIQSILYMRLYKLRKDHIMRNVKMVTEHFRGPPKSTQAPSPYTSNAKITGTPSPLSPTPSPSGSVGSVGSNGSNETMTTPSRTSKPSSASSTMTSPVNVCIPQKIHAMTQQHVLQVNNLVYSQDTWDQAQPVVLEFRDYFMDLDRTCGPLTLHSSIVHMIEYIGEGVKRIRDAQKSEKS